MERRQDNLPFYIDCAMSRRDDCCSIFKFGENPDLDIAHGSADIWEFAPTVNNYVYQSSAGIHYISSTDAGDTQDIEVEGLDANWNKQIITVTLAGQTKTQIGTGETFIRVYRARNVGTTNLAGSVYIYEDDTVVAGVPNTNSKVKAYIMNGNNQTLMTQVPVPAGKTGLIKWVQSSLSKKKDGILGVTIYIRPFGQVFQVKESFNVMSTGSSCVHKDFDGIPIVATEKSDIVMRAEANTDAMAVTGSMGIIFVDN